MAYDRQKINGQSDCFDMNYKEENKITLNRPELAQIAVDTNIGICYIVYTKTNNIEYFPYWIICFPYSHHFQLFQLWPFS